MPHISLSLYPGRNKNELEAISNSLRDCLVEKSGWKSKDISVSIEEIEANNFIETLGKKIISEKIILTSDIVK